MLSAGHSCSVQKGRVHREQPKVQWRWACNLSSLVILLLVWRRHQWLHSSILDVILYLDKAAAIMLFSWSSPLHTSRPVPLLPRTLLACLWACWIHSIGCFHMLLLSGLIPICLSLCENRHGGNILHWIIQPLFWWDMYLPLDILSLHSRECLCLIQCNTVICQCESQCLTVDMWCSG